MLRRVHEHEIRGPAHFDQPAIELAHARGIAGGEAEGDLCRNVAQRRQHGDHADDAERLHARTRRRVGAEDDPLELVHARWAVRSVKKRRALVAVVHESPGPRWQPSQMQTDLVVRQRRVAAVDVADDIRVGLEHDVLVDQPGARNRRAAGMDGALDAVFARPRHHACRAVGPSFTAAKPDLAQQLDAGLRQDP